MGQYSNEDGGIFLIEKVEDIARLPIQDNDEFNLYDANHFIAR